SPPELVDAGPAPAFAITADLNGDPWPDLVVMSAALTDGPPFAPPVEHSELWVLLGSSDGWSPPSGPVATFVGTSDIFGDDLSAVFVTAADLNRVGHADLVVIDHRGQAFTLTGAGDGSFAPAQPVAGELLSSVAVANLVGDGSLDLITAGHNGMVS